VCVCVCVCVCLCMCARESMCVRTNLRPPEHEHRLAPCTHNRLTLALHIKMMVIRMVATKMVLVFVLQSW
jgi:hypothetical protein